LGSVAAADLGFEQHHARVNLAWFHLADFAIVGEEIIMLFTPENRFIYSRENGVLVVSLLRAWRADPAGHEGS
jgi:hypothetical protein